MVRVGATLSEQEAPEQALSGQAKAESKDAAIERWQAPFFDAPAEIDRPDPEEIEKLAQARGFQIGKWEGLESGRLEAETMVKHLTAIIDEMAQPFRQLDQLVAGELAQLATIVARQVIRRELSLDSSTVTRVAEEALKTLSTVEGEVVVYLNPADITLVKELLLESLEGRPWKLVEDAELMPGGCRVKTPLSYIDASVETQMEHVFAALLDASEKQLDE